MYTAKFSHGRPYSVDYTPNVFVAAGTVVIVNGRVGVSSADIPAGTLGSLQCGIGAVDILNDGLAVADAQDVYFNTTNQQSTPIGAGNAYLGKAEGAVVASAAGTTYTRVVLVPPSVSSVVGNVIADPGAAGAIPVSASGIVNLTSAGAETRTLAAPAGAGIGLIINAQNVTAGPVTVNSATTNIGNTGLSHIALSANGKSIELLSIATNVAGTYRWALRYNDGTTLS